jgi:hypothetical protein
VRSKAARLLGSRVRIPLRPWMFDHSVCLCCVGSSICDELITRSEESYRLCVCLIVCGLETSTMGAAWAQFGLLRHTEIRITGKPTKWADDNYVTSSLLNWLSTQISNSLANQEYKYMSSDLLLIKLSKDAVKTQNISMILKCQVAVASHCLQARDGKLVTGHPTYGGKNWST